MWIVCSQCFLPFAKHKWFMPDHCTAQQSLQCCSETFASTLISTFVNVSVWSYPTYLGLVLCPQFRGCSAASEPGHMEVIYALEVVFGPLLAFSSILRCSWLLHCYYELNCCAVLGENAVLTEQMSIQCGRLRCKHSLYFSKILMMFYGYDWKIYFVSNLYMSDTTLSWWLWINQ